MLNTIMEYGFEVSYEIITEDIDDFEARCVIFEEVDFGSDEQEENGFYNITRRKQKRDKYLWTGRMFQKVMKSNLKRLRTLI